MFSIYVFMVPNLLEHFLTCPFLSFSVKRVHEACHADLKFCKLCQTLFSPKLVDIYVISLFSLQNIHWKCCGVALAKQNRAFLLHTDFFFSFFKCFPKTHWFLSFSETVFVSPSSMYVVAFAYSLAEKKIVFSVDK